MTQLTYNFCLLYKSRPLSIIGLQTENTLILADNTFADAEKNAIKSAKIMTKQHGYLMSTKLIKFNGTKIELASNKNLTLKQKTHIGDISLVKKLDTSTISSKGVICTKLLPKDQYMAQQARKAYFASTYQPEGSFDLLYTIQSIEFTTDNVATLNKKS